MNTYTIAAFIIVLLAMFFIAFIIGFRRIVYSIMKNEGITVTKDVDSPKDFKSIYLLLKQNNNLGKYERKILWQHLIFTGISLLLWCMFVLIMFFTDW
jgi:hypothetical protein